MMRNKHDMPRQWKTRLLKTMLIWSFCAGVISCGSKQKVAGALPLSKVSVAEHSATVFIVMYDAEIGKEPLLKAIEKYHCEVVYDYHSINGMALKKPDGKSLEETMDLIRKVKGVLSVDYDHIYHLPEPIRPNLEIK